MQGTTPISVGIGNFEPIAEKLGLWICGGDEELLPRTGASNIEQVSLGCVNFFEIRFVGNSFDAFLKRNHFIIAGHHNDGPEFKSLGEVHRAESDSPCRRTAGVFHFGPLQARCLQGGARSWQLALASHEDSHFVGMKVSIQ
jgi:hypothetical protein